MAATTGHGKIGVYKFIWDLIQEGQDAHLVNQRGRYALNWPAVVRRYFDFQAIKTQKNKKNFIQKSASNGLRAALLNFYKKEGAFEFKDARKFGANNEVIWRHFQMPHRIYRALMEKSGQSCRAEFSSDDSNFEEADSANGPQSASSPDDSASQTSTDTSGFYDAMDIDGTLGSSCEPGDAAIDDSQSSSTSGLHAGNQYTEANNCDLVSSLSEMSEDEYYAALNDVISSSITHEDLKPDFKEKNLVSEIFPCRDSTKGGNRFSVMLAEPLPSYVSSVVAYFDDIGPVDLQKTNEFAICGIIPPAPKAGPVVVTINANGQYLGNADFVYFDPMEEMINLVVQNPRSLDMWIMKQLGNESGWQLDFVHALKVAQMENGQGASSSASQTRTVKPVDILQLMVYTAAKINAQQFVRVLFSTSVGQVVFRQYKDKTQHPQDVARANGHQELAQYLEEIHQKLQKNTDQDDNIGDINWQELRHAVNTLWDVTGTLEASKEQENDNHSSCIDNESDYYADGESSSGLSDGAQSVSALKEICQNAHISASGGKISKDVKGQHLEADETQSTSADTRQGNKAVLKLQQRFHRRVNTQNDVRRQHSEAADETQSITPDTRQGDKAVLTLPQSFTQVNAENDKREQHAEASETQSMTQDTGQGDKAVLTLPQSYTQVNAENDKREQHAEASETQSMTQDTGQGDKAVLTLPQSYTQVNAENDKREQHAEASETQSMTQDTGQGDRAVLTLLQSYQQVNVQFDEKYQHAETSETQSMTQDIRQGDKADLLALPQSYQLVNVHNDVRGQHSEAGKTQSATPDNREQDKTLLTLHQSYQRVNVQNVVRRQRSEVEITASVSGTEQGTGPKLAVGTVSKPSFATNSLTSLTDISEVDRTQETGEVGSWPERAHVVECSTSAAKPGPTDSCQQDVTSHHKPVPEQFSGPSKPQLSSPSSWFWDGWFFNIIIIFVVCLLLFTILSGVIPFRNISKRKCGSMLHIGRMSAYAPWIKGSSPDTCHSSIYTNGAWQNRSHAHRNASMTWKRVPSSMSVKFHKALGKGIQDWRATRTHEFQILEVRVSNLHPLQHPVISAWEALYGKNITQEQRPRRHLHFSDFTTTRKVLDLATGRLTSANGMQNYHSALSSVPQMYHKCTTNVLQKEYHKCKTVGNEQRRKVKFYGEDLASCQDCSTCLEKHVIVNKYTSKYTGCRQVEGFVAVKSRPQSSASAQSSPLSRPLESFTKTALPDATAFFKELIQSFVTGFVVSFLWHGLVIFVWKTVIDLPNPEKECDKLYRRCCLNQRASAEGSDVPLTGCRGWMNTPSECACEPQSPSHSHRNRTSPFLAMIAFLIAALLADLIDAGVFVIERGEFQLMSSTRNIEHGEILPLAIRTTNFSHHPQEWMDKYDSLHRLFGTQDNGCATVSAIIRKCMVENITSNPRENNASEYLMQDLQIIGPFGTGKTFSTTVQHLCSFCPGTADDEIRPQCALQPSPEKLEISLNSPGLDLRDTLSDFKGVFAWFHAARTYSDKVIIEFTAYGPTVHSALNIAFSPTQHKDNPEDDKLVLWCYVAASNVNYSSTPQLHKIKHFPDYLKEDYTSPLVNTCSTTAVKGGELCLHHAGFCGLRGVLEKKKKHLVITPNSCYFGILTKDLEDPNKTSGTWKHNGCSMTVQAGYGEDEPNKGGYVCAAFLYAHQNPEKLKKCK